MQKKNIHNGAYYYAREIEDIILPRFSYMSLFIITAGGTLQAPREIPDGAVFVCHHNQNPKEVYGAYFGKNILWVCSKPSTVEKLEKSGEKAVYIPLSIDTKYVEKFKTKKTKDIAFVGNAWSFKDDYLASLPKNIDQLSGMKRDDLLAEMAKYRRVIAEGRCNMEAQVLGCEVEIPDYKDPSIGAIPREVLDTRGAIPYWQEFFSGNEIGVALKTKKGFTDMHDRTTRRVGDVFTASEDRAAELLSNKLDLVEQL
jgi:hypothetical protein